MKYITTILAVTVVLTLAGPARADWDEGDPAKWVQLPDLSTNGMDVKTGPTWVWDETQNRYFWGDPTKTLANDFQCGKTGPITDIHIWGSWKNDILPGQWVMEEDPNNGFIMVYKRDPAFVWFSVSLHEDIPATQSPTGYSMPGALIAADDFVGFTVRPYAENLLEGWYDPNTGEYIPSDPAQGGPGDTICYQYNLHITNPDFRQEEGNVYWVDITVSPEFFPEDPDDPGNEDDIPPEFGWKTSLNRWNDDAVWIDREELIPPDGAPAGWIPTWRDLHYPDGHPLQGDSIDLAFVLVPEPGTLMLFGLGGVGVLLRRRRSQICLPPAGRRDRRGGKR